MTHKIALIVALCLVAPLTMAQEIPTRESFSLLKVLEQIGYGPMTSTAIPIESEEDIARAVRGEAPRKVETDREFWWPFAETAVSPNLSLMAFALDSRGFPNTKSATRTVAVVSLPDRKGQEPQLVWAWIPNDVADAHVNSVAFMSENLLRVGVMTKSETSYAFDYYFTDINEKKNSFLLSSLLQEKGPIHHIRHFSDRIYAVSYGDVENPVVELIAVDPIAKNVTTLLQMAGGREVVTHFMHGVVDEPGRDVWDMGGGNLRITYSRNVNNEWKTFAVEVYDGGKAARTVKTERMDRKESRVIEGTDRFLQATSEDYLQIVELDSSGRSSLYYSSSLVSPWQRLNKVTQGFVGEERNHPDYKTFLYRKGQDPELLWEDRLIQSVQRDGGFVGVASSGRRDNGEVTAVRVIYDLESLVGEELSGFADAKACADQLLARIGKSAGRKKK